MKTIEIFDPPMCCSTGVCGPSIDRYCHALLPICIGLQIKAWR